MQSILTMCNLVTTIHATTVYKNYHKYMSSKGNVLRKSTSQESKIRDERKKVGKKEEEKKLAVKKDSTVMKETKSSSRRAVSNQIVSTSKNLSGSRTQTVASGARSKLTKQTSEEKRGVSTIFMPSKKSYTSKPIIRKMSNPKAKSECLQESGRNPGLLVRVKLRCSIEI
ncbi:GSCOCG00011858001-RA-CDS [Cotesia congregata]|nr:GSCOCG00011858001-RA-CDS [Cotesia congregata]